MPGRIDHTLRSRKGLLPPTRIPLWVDNPGLGCRLHMDRYPIHQEKTGLHAVAH